MYDVGHPDMRLEGWLFESWLHMMAMIYVSNNLNECFTTAVRTQCRLVKAEAEGTTRWNDLPSPSYPAVIVH
jgi:hypothetical protein